MFCYYSLTQLKLEYVNMIEIHNEMQYDKWIIKRNSINSL